MFEKFTAAGAADFRQRYEGTYGFYRDENGKRLLTKLSYIRNEVCVFIDSRGVEYRLNPDAESNIGFEFIPPKAAYHNTPNETILVSRIAARQFQRGLSYKNTNLWSLMPGGLMQVKMDFPLLERIYLKAISPRDAVAAFSTRSSVAISKQLALTSLGVVFLYEKPIGKYTRKDNHLSFKLDEPSLWKTEVQDACRDIGFTVEVS